MQCGGCCSQGQGGSGGGFPDGSLPLLVTEEKDGGTVEGDPAPEPQQGGAPG